MPAPSKRGKGGTSGGSTRTGRPAKLRKVKEVVFDEDARKEYLTGFSKRKKERQTLVRNKAIEREREEKNEARRALRQERKERAALNVANAKELYGDAGAAPSLSDDEASGSGSEDEVSGAPRPDEATYEAADLITTVVVEPFSLSRSASPVLRARSVSDSPPPTRGDDDGEEKKKKVTAINSIHKKRVKNKPQSRPKMSREDKKERAKGGKKVKASFLKGSAGTKGRANK